MDDGILWEQRKLDALRQNRNSALAAGMFVLLALLVLLVLDWSYGAIQITVCVEGVLVIQQL